jgi:hypothetical protein
MTPEGPLAALLSRSPSLQVMFESISGDVDLQDQPFVFAGFLVERVVAEFASGDARSIAALLAATEYLLGRGRPDWRYFAVIGVIEGVQNAVASRNLSADQLDPFFGSETRHFWNLTSDLWSGAITAEQFNVSVRDGR